MSSVRFEKAGEGTVLHWNADTLVLTCRDAFAPGAPFQITLDIGDGGESVVLDARAHGSKRRSGGDFEVRARLVSLRKEVRARMDASLPR